jgi:DNA-binding transcriptional LysR family regulator
VVASSYLVTVLPRHLIASTGMTDMLIAKELPFDLPEVEVDMLWHERDARNPAHRWLRNVVTRMTSEAVDSGWLSK